MGKEVGKVGKEEKMEKKPNTLPEMPNPLPSGMLLKRKVTCQRREENNLVVKYIYICDPSAIVTLEATSKDSPVGSRANKCLREGTLKTCAL